MKILLLLSIPLVLFAIYRLALNKNSSDLPDISTQIHQSADNVLKHPYAVEKLNDKVNQNGKITIERQVSAQPGFKSHIVSYYSEGLKQYALMNIPLGDQPDQGWSIIIVGHGYIPPDQYSTINSYKNTSAYYASQGFLVLKPDYRGHDQSEGDPEILFSRSQYAVDVLNLIAALDSLPHVDINHVYFYGHSMGGEVGLQVAQNTDLIKGLTLWAPAVAEFPESVMHFINKRRPTPTELSKLQASLAQLLTNFGSNQLSSLTQIYKINVPVLIHHSVADESVPYLWGENLVNHLKGQNKTVTFYTYQNDNHNISGHWSQALTRDVQFFNSFK